MESDSSRANQGSVTDVVDRLSPYFAALATFLVFLPFCRIGVLQFHEGILLKPALDLLDGDVLYRDSISIYGPLTTWIQALFLKVGGLSMISLKIGTALAYAAAAGILVACWRSILPLSLTAVSVVLVWLTASFYQGPFYCWSSVYALVFQAAALYFALRSIRGASGSTSAVLCGVCAGLAFWCRYTIGLFLAAALAAGYASIRIDEWRLGAGVESRRPTLKLGGFLIGLGSVLGGVAAYLAASGAWSAFVEQGLELPTRLHVSTMRGGILSRVVFCLFNGEEVALLLESIPREPFAPKSLVKAAACGLTLLLALGVFLSPLMRRRPIDPSAAPDGRSRLRAVSATVGVLFLAVLFSPLLRRHFFWATLIPVYLLAGVAGRFVVWFVRGPSCSETENERLAARICGLAALASWMQYFPMSDEPHRFWSLYPCMGFFLYLSLRQAGGRTKVVMIGLALLAPAALDVAASARGKLGAPLVRIAGPDLLAGVLLPPEKAREHRRFVDAIEAYRRTRPEFRIITYGYDSLYSCYAPDLGNPDPYTFYFQTLPMPPGLLDARLAYIDERRPVLLFLVESGVTNASEATLPESLRFQGYDAWREKILARFPYRELVRFRSERGVYAAYVPEVPPSVPR